MTDGERESVSRVRMLYGVDARQEQERPAVEQVKKLSSVGTSAKSRRDSEAFLLRCRLQLAIPRSRDGRGDSSGGVIGEQCPR
jgi:hypothetical protein